MSAAAAFDRLAGRYDEVWTHSPAGRAQRETVWRRIATLFQPRERVLDLGCGTGEDAVRLAQAGVRVHAIDAAPGMVRRTVEKARAHGVHLTAQVLAVEDLSRLEPAAFDGALANFGVLNCVADLRGAAAGLARLVRPQGKVAVCVMGRFCLWEIIWYLLHGEKEKALRRLKGSAAASMGFPVFYPAGAEMQAAFAPFFRLVRSEGIGILTPPSYVRAPLPLKALALADRAVSRWPGARSLGDHRLLVFERNGRPAPSAAPRAVQIEEALEPERKKIYARFFDEYSSIRRAEGRGCADPAYYRALPFLDLSGRHTAQWAIRAKTFRYLETRLLPAEPADILDLGAGNGWLCYRLAQLGHRPVAVDLRTDELDGLGAAARHFALFPLFQAEFDRLPFESARFDLAIFNAAFHYSVDYKKTLLEAARCLRPGGRIIIMDSPLYKRREHGEWMREERRRQFAAQYGFRSDSIPSLDYLYEGQLEELAREVGLRWEIHRPWYGWAWRLRPWKARLLGRRPPSRFWILAGCRSTA
jgi:ubiquinone/menaquinone biosynthesis C-methylase UbiE